MFSFLFKKENIMKEHDIIFHDIDKKQIKDIKYYLNKYIRQPMLIRYKKTIKIHIIMMTITILSIIPEFFKCIIPGIILLIIFYILLKNKIEDINYINENILAKSENSLENNRNIKCSDIYKINHIEKDITLGHDEYDLKYSPDINISIFLSPWDNENIEIILNKDYMNFYSYGLKSHQYCIIYKINDIYFVIPLNINNEQLFMEKEGNYDISRRENIHRNK